MRTQQDKSVRMPRWVAMALALSCCLATFALGQSSSPSPSPTPQTPEQKFTSARARLSQANQRIKIAWAKLKQSRDQLAKAQQEYDAVVAQLREERMEDPLIRDAATRIIEARAAAETQRSKALTPLRLNFSYTRLQREQTDATIRLEELMKARQKAFVSRLPFDPQLQAEIGRLSLSVLKLSDEVAEIEDQRLDEHEGYQAASEEMDKALEEAAQAMKASRDLRDGNPRKQAAMKAMQAAYAEAAASGKAYTEARRERQQAAAMALSAQSEYDAARRRP